MKAAKPYYADRRRVGMHCLPVPGHGTGRRSTAYYPRLPAESTAAGWLTQRWDGIRTGYA
jgi:hypothetical protein